MARTLLTVSGTIPDDLEALIAADRRPRPDYRELAASFDADLVDQGEARRRAGWIGKVIDRVAGPNAVLAYVCWRSRKRYDTIFTDGEQVGLPLAVLLRFTPGRRATHLMIVHILSVPKKVKLISLLRLAGKIDLYFVYATRQKEFIERELGVAPRRVLLTPFAVDTDFFHPEPRLTSSDMPVISSAGLEHRDYDTLIEAVRDLPVRLVIASGSPWSKRTDHARSNDLPSNVEVTKFDLHGLRELYQQSRFVVVPLKDVEFQAGITTILEAMAMARAVVCTRTSGQTDTIVHEVNGLYVPPADIAAMRSAIVSLLDDPAKADALGAAGRAWAIDHANTPTYAANLAHAARSARQPGEGLDASGLTVRRVTNPDRIVDLLSPHEPRTTIALSEMINARRRSPYVRAWTIEEAGTVLGVVVVARKAFDLWYAWALLHDERAAPTAAKLIDRSNAVALNGVGVDIAPLLPHLQRLDFHRVLPWTVSTYPHDIVEASTEGTRLAATADLEQLVALYRDYEYGYEVTVSQLRRTLRDLVRDFPVIVAEADGRIVSALLVVAKTHRFMALDAMTVAPDHRKSGLLWRVATKTQEVANQAGLSIIASTAPSNPVTIELLQQQDHWVSARLHPRRRFKGQNRLRAMVVRRDPRRHREPAIYRDPTDPNALAVERTRTDSRGRIIR